MNKLQRTILSYSPIPIILSKSKNWHLPGFQGLPVYNVLQFFRKQIKQQGLAERASAIAYNFIMALPPSLLFLFTLIPNLPFLSKRSIKYQLHSLILDIIPSKVYNKQVIAFADTFIDGNKLGLLSFGLLLTLFFSSNGVMGIMRSFNKNYEGFEKRKGLQKRGVALRLTIVIFGLLFGYFILLIMQGALLKMVVQSDTLRTIITYSRWILIIMLVYLTIGFIFRYAPAVQKKWNFSSAGTVLATTLSLIATLAFSLFVSNFARYNALYGSIGTIMMLMALIYLNSLALLIGFELNVSIHTLKARDEILKKEEKKEEFL